VRRLIWIAVVCASLCALWAAAGASAAKLTLVGKFNQPIFVTSDPLDPNRLLIAEREGGVSEAGPGGTSQLLDIHELVSCCESERGLLSIAPAPDFDSTGRLYVAYTGAPAAGGAEGDIHLDSFHPLPAGQMARDPILAVAHSQNENHNGGQLQFGPDGYLYLSLGDGGGGGDPDGNGQNTETLLGKILRIDPHPGQVPAYAIPPGNPFASGPGRDEVWAYGLRNPWRFSFDRATGDTVIADVGQDAREEIDFAPGSGGGVVGGAGANYGWNCREGFIPYTGAPSGCGTVGFTDPVFDYPHDEPSGGGLHGCSIIGGYVVRDQSLPDLYGRYLYSDYCNEEIRSLALPASATGLASGDRSEGLTVESPTSFGQDSCGRVYVVSAAGPVYRFEGPAPAACASAGAAAVALPAPGSPSPRSHSARHRHRHLLLSAKRLRPGGSRFRVKVRLTPCRGDGGGEPTQLNRNGKSFSSKRLNRHCRARFLLTVAKPTPLRAFARVGGEGDHVGSRRLVLMPPRR
jgi:hypothetical protein